MVRRFDHIDLRVTDLTAAGPFYERLLPLFGFRLHERGASWLQFISGAPSESAEASEFFGVVESPTHRANETRLAFWATSLEEVDRLAARLGSIGACNVEGPEWDDPTYYAVWFEDPAGNRLEICHRTRNSP